jgi:hypothetical protein
MTTLVEEMAKAIDARRMRGICMGDELARVALDCVLKRLREPDEGMLHAIWKVQVPVVLPRGSMLNVGPDTARQLCNALAAHLGQERSRE